MEKGSNWSGKTIACMDDMDEEESMHMFMMSCSLKGMIPLRTSLDSDESVLLFSEAVEVLVFILFFNVEFQKFFISLSVRPGRRAAI